MGKDTDTAAVHRWPGDAGSLSPAGPLSPSPQRSTDGGKTFASCDVSPKTDLNAVAVVPGSTTTAWAVGAAVSSKTVSCWCGMTQRGGPARCKFPAARSTPQATASSVLLPGAVGAQDHRRRCHLDTANSHQLAALPDLDESHFHAGCECVLRGWQLWHVSALGMCVAGRVLRSWTQAGCSRANGTATPQPNVVIRQQVALCTGQLCCHPSPCPPQHLAHHQWGRSLGGRELHPHQPVFDQRAGVGHSRIPQRAGGHQPREDDAQVGCQGCCSAPWIKIAV